MYTVIHQEREGETIFLFWLVKFLAAANLHSVPHHRLIHARTAKYDNFRKSGVGYPFRKNLCAGARCLGAPPTQMGVTLVTGLVLCGS